VQLIDFRGDGYNKILGLAKQIFKIINDVFVLIFVFKLKLTINNR
jgi:hypothetical protein